MYWLDACAIANSVSENVNPATVIIEPAIAESIPRDPSRARAENARVFSEQLAVDSPVHLDEPNGEANAADDNQHGDEPQTRTQV